MPVPSNGVVRLCVAGGELQGHTALSCDASSDSNGVAPAVELSTFRRYFRAGREASARQVQRGSSGHGLICFPEHFTSIAL
jgi:hypothetical protein